MRQRSRGEGRFVGRAGGALLAATGLLLASGGAAAQNRAPAVGSSAPAVAPTGLGGAAGANSQPATPGLAAAGARPDVATPNSNPATPGSPGQTPPAGAQTPPADPQAGLREAQQHLQRALDFFRRQDYTNAIHEFELAHSAAPSADILYNIARAHELQSHFDEAVQFYQRYLRDKVDPPDRADVERRIRELGELAERRREAMRRNTPTAQLRFEVNRPGASLFVGERAVGNAPFTNALTLEPGPYELRATAEGMQSWRANVRLRRGDVFTARVDLQPATRYRTIPRSHVASYVIGGVGVAGLGVGAVFGILSALADECGGNVNNPEMLVTGDCLRRDRAFIADVSFGAGAGLLLTAAIVYFIEAGASRTERILAPPAAAPGPTGPAIPTPPSAR